ncbi:CU044_2847 family protein [Streptomyces mayteni]
MGVVEVPLTDEGAETVSVQVRELDEGMIRVGRPGQPPVARAARSLDAMLGTVRPVAERFVARLREMPDPPEEITLDFGVVLTAEADMVIASGSGEANFAVSLTWRPRAEP